MLDFDPTRSSVEPTVGLARKGLVLLAVLLWLGVVPVARAAPIVEWDLAGATGQTAAVLWLDANLSATDIVPSAGVTAWSSTAQDGFVAASNWATAAPDPTRYYAWSITAAGGYGVEYQSITLALFRGIQGANHGAQLWDLRASSDGFAGSDLFLQTFDLSGSAADTQTLFTGVDISSIGTVGGTVTFRLYGYDYTSPTDFSGLGNDSGWLIYGTGANPVVEGRSVVMSAIPEPGTGTLVLLGLVLMAARRRRGA